MNTSVTNSRTHNVDTLKGILPYSREAIPAFYDLAMRFSGAAWRDLFVRMWQQQAQCVAELENKIGELGGRVGESAQETVLTPADPEDEPSDPTSLDKKMLLLSLNQQSHLMHLYTEARKSTLPFDVRMVLHRHQLQAREALEHLTSLYLSYASHPTHSSYSTMGTELAKFSVA